LEGGELLAGACRCERERSLQQELMGERSNPQARFRGDRKQDDLLRTQL